VNTAAVITNEAKIWRVRYVWRVFKRSPSLAGWREGATQKEFPGAGGWNDG